MSAGLLNLFAVIVLFGVVLWFVCRFIPMAPIITRILNLLVGIVLVVYILQFLSIINNVIPMINLIN
ncbi:MAG: hypothetical protein P1U74_02505 [Legionellaceae bacterium]|nr:hypothetical protein [Legionellaceae bacterium]